MRSIFIAVFLCVASIGYCDPSQPDAKAAAKKSAPKQLGTEERPLSITIQSNEADKVEAERREAERQQKKESDDKLIFWSRAMAFLAIAQLLALGVHAIFFRSQSNRLKENVHEMRREFATTHRPRIHVRAIRAESTQRKSGVSGQVICTFVNVGETLAVVTGLEIDLHLHPTDAVPLPSFDADIRPYSVSLAPGEAHEASIEYDEDPREIVHRGWWLHAAGRIRYLDGNRTPRTTSFCAPWDAASHAFRRMDGSRAIDYEYED